MYLYKNFLRKATEKKECMTFDYYHYNTRKETLLFLSGTTYVVRINVNDVSSGDKVRPLMRIYGPLVSSAELRLQRPQGRVWG